MRVEAEIHDRTIPLTTMEKIVLHAHEETILPIAMERIPMHLTESLAIAKLFFPQLMQHCVNHLTTQVHCDVQGHAVLALHNGTSESITLPKHTHVGVLDLGYFHKSCDELVRMFSEDYTFLSDKETLDEMYQFCDNLRNFKPTTPDGKDPYPWLPIDDPRCFKSDAMLMEETINLSESILNEHQKTYFQQTLMKYHNAFSLRDEIGCCPFFMVKLELKDKSLFFICPYPVKEDGKKVIDDEMWKGCLLGYLKKGLSSYSSPVMVIPHINSSVKYCVVSDFRHLNSRLVTLNPSVPLLHDVIQQLGASECEVLSVIDLHNVYHTLRLDEESKKYCGITPYYRSPSYLYQRLGMGLSVSPAIWQNFINAVDWEALAKQLIEKAVEPKAEPEALLHEVLNPIPVDIDLRGHVPDTQTRTT